MGLRKKITDKVDDVAAAIVYAGQKVGGEKGEHAANVVTNAVLGGHYCPPDKKCRIC